MPCTAADLIPRVAKFVGDSGVCADTEKGKQEVIDALNEAIPLLMKRLDAKGTLWRWDVPAYGGCFSLPEDCLEVRNVWLNGQTLEQRDDWYEGRLSVGKQDGCLSPHRNQNAFTTCRGPELIDIGDGYAIPNPWPAHAFTRLALVAEHDGDAGQVVQVHIINEYGEEKKEFLTLVPDQLAVVSESNVTDIRFFKKPVTHGNVKAYVYYQNGIRTGFALYKPRTTVATFRKKKLPRSTCNGTLSVYGKMRFQPIVEETDPLQICDADALEFALKALAAKERSDGGGDYNTNLALALNELEKELENGQSRAAVSQAQFKSPFGRGAFRRVWS